LESLAKQGVAANMRRQTAARSARFAAAGDESSRVRDIVSRCAHGPRESA
jgi:hypothetical protein